MVITYSIFMCRLKCYFNLVVYYARVIVDYISDVVIVDFQCCAGGQLSSNIWEMLGLKRLWKIKLFSVSALYGQKESDSGSKIVNMQKFVNHSGQYQKVYKWVEQFRNSYVWGTLRLYVCYSKREEEGNKRCSSLHSMLCDHISTALELKYCKFLHVRNSISSCNWNKFVYCSRLTSRSKKKCPSILISGLIVVLKLYDGAV